MIQRGDGAHFAVESLAEALRGHLDRDVTTQPGIERLVDLAHAARPQEAIESGTARAVTLGPSARRSARQASWVTARQRTSKSLGKGP